MWRGHGAGYASARQLGVSMCANVVESGGEHARRALARIVVALLGLLVGGIVYLHPTLSAPAERSAPGPAALQQAGAPVFFNVSFGDAEHGVLQMFSQLNPPNRPPSIYVTSDGGRTWRPLAKFSSPLAAVTFVDRQRMLAEEFGRGAPSLLISDDGGLTWQPLAADPRQFAIRGLWPVFLGSDGWWLDLQPVAVSGSQPSSGGRMWRTSDGGKTWTLLAASGISQIGSGQLRFVDTRHGALAVILAGTQRLPAVMATENGGDSWRMTATFDTPLAGTRPLGILLLQHGARLLAWLTVSSWDFQIAGPPPGESAVASTFTSVSDDGGATWGPLSPGPVTTTRYGAAAAAVDGTGRLLLLDGRRLWISEDDGTTWVARVAAISAGLVPAFIAAAVPGSIYATAVRSSDVPSLGSAGAALLRSSDGGIHWTEVRLPRLST